MPGLYQHQAATWGQLEAIQLAASNSVNVFSPRVLERGVVIHQAFDWQRDVARAAAPPTSDLRPPTSDLRP